MGRRRDYVALSGKLTLTFVLVTQPAFGQQAQTKLLGLREISFSVGICDTRGRGPPAQWLSLPFYTPEGAWPLSQSTWVQRWGRGHSFGKGGFLTSPCSSHGDSVPAVTSPRSLRAAMVGLRALTELFPPGGGGGADSPQGTVTNPLRPPHLDQLLLWFLDIRAYPASGRSSPPSPSLPPPPLPPPLSPPLPPPLPPSHLQPNQGGGATTTRSTCGTANSAAFRRTSAIMDAQA